jgi:Zn-dependent protease with chaperone function
MGEQRPEPASQARVWSPRRAVELTRLDDKRLVEYRHPAERRALVTIALVVVGFFAALALLHLNVPALLRWVPFPFVRALVDALHPARLLPIMLLLFFGLAAFEAVGLALRYFDLPYDAVEITPRSFPELGPVVEELKQRFDLPLTRVFVTHSAPPFGLALGVREPYLIAFSAGMLGAVTADQLRFLLGRQLGHAKLGHTRMALFFGSSRAAYSLNLLRQLRSLVFGNYQRAQELSADRIGLLATRDLSPVLSLLIKMQIGAARGAKIDLEFLAPRAAELSAGRAGRLARRRQLLTAEPRFIVRLLELTRWAGLPREPAAGGSLAVGAPASARAASGAAGEVGASAARGPAGPQAAPTGASPPPAADDSTATGGSSSGLLDSGSKAAGRPARPGER